MVQVARVAPKLLENSTPLVIDFFQSQRHPDGGFCNRAGEPDIYYSVFGIEGFQSLQQSLPEEWLRSYVESFGTGDKLDLVHLSCLARCWGGLSIQSRQDCPTEVLAARILEHRTPDGGYDILPGSQEGNLYGCFLAIGAFEDVGYPIPHTDSLTGFISGLRDPQGGFFNSRAMPVSLVPQTAAAVTLLRHLGARCDDPRVGEWILSCFHPQGGFRAGTDITIPDLLSTATALHALASLKIELGAGVDLCLDFIDSLWTNRGGFYGHWEDTHADVEYTYYGLLALGHLSLLSP